MLLKSCATTPRQASMLPLLCVTQLRFELLTLDAPGGLSALTVQSTRASRARRPFTRKSCAPAFSAATAASSPIVPETMMKGSVDRCCRTPAAAGALKVGMW